MSPAQSAWPSAWPRWVPPVGVPSRGSWTPSYSCTGATRFGVGCGLPASAEHTPARAMNSYTTQTTAAAGLHSLQSYVSRTSAVNSIKNHMCRRLRRKPESQGRQPANSLSFPRFSLGAHRHPPFRRHPPQAPPSWRVILAKLAVSYLLQLSITDFERRPLERRSPLTRAPVHLYRP